MSETSKPKAGAETAADFDKIREDVAALREDLADLVKHLTRDARGGLSEEAQQLYAKIADQGERSANAIVRGVEERPLLALLLAFGIGFLGGNLLRR